MKQELEGAEEDFAVCGCCNYSKRSTTGCADNEGKTGHLSREIQMIFKKNHMEIIELKIQYKTFTGWTSQANGNDRGETRQKRCEKLKISKFYEKQKFTDTRWSRDMKHRRYKDARTESFKLLKPKIESKPQRQQERNNTRNHNPINGSFQKPWRPDKSGTSLKCWEKTIFNYNSVSNKNIVQEWRD